MSASETENNTEISYTQYDEIIQQDLENKQEIMELLGMAEKAEGVRIFIGSENKLFSLSGSSMIVTPYKNEKKQVIGVLGVIGPTRMNYGKIIPMVNYTAELMKKILG